MRQELTNAFLGLFQESKQLTGTLEVIETYGGSTLDSVCEHWVEYGVSNLEEIYWNAMKLVDVIKHCERGKNDSKQLKADILAILDDFAYHASIFGVYYFIIDDVMKLKQSKLTAIDDNFQEKSCTSNEEKNISYIASNWDSELAFDEKVDCLKNLIIHCRSIKFYFDALFEQNLINDDSVRYCLLRKLYSSILILQHVWSIMLDDHERVLMRQEKENQKIS